MSPGLQEVNIDDAFPHWQPGDQLHHPWKYTRRDVPHTWYAHEQFPLMGTVNRDEAVILYNIALRFAGRHALEIGSWIGWSTCHLALAGVWVDAIDPAHDDAGIRVEVEASLAACGVADRVNLTGGESPGMIAELAARGRRWSLFFVDGDHEGAAPARDALACLPYATRDCAFVFHDMVSPDVAAGLRAMQAEGFNVALYQTAQIMGIAWRGDVVPVAHVPDPSVAWQIPAHLVGLPIVGVDFEEVRPSAEKSLLALDRPRSVTTRPSVCVVSNEIEGPFRNGGIGTSMTGLAEALAAEGFDVTVLYTGNIWTPDVHLGQWRSRYAERNIKLVPLGFTEMLDVSGPVRGAGFVAPFLVYRELTKRKFDVVHFNDCCGDGSLALAAKRLGLDFQETLFVLALHSPSQWVLELNQVLPTALLLTAYNYAERLSAECADLAWSPSRYMLSWVRDHGFELPEQTFVQQYSIPSGGVPEVQYGRTTSPREIVFFGRLEERKGLRLFCNALQVLADELSARQVSVTFLGKSQFCGGIPADEYIAGRSAEWRFPVKLLTELGRKEALAYLRRSGTLAVMPSPVDNSPCTVYEALCWGIPFLAARTGGIPELVDEDDHERVLFDYTTESLRQALLSALDDGGWVARPAVPQAEGHRALFALHERWREFLPESRQPPEPQRWVAAVVDHAAGDDLDATLDSLSECPWIRRVMVVDRSGEAVSRDHRRVDLTREDPEVAVREILSLAEDHVLLIHSGVSLLMENVGKMLGAFDVAPADGLLPTARVSDRSGATRFMPPLGGSPAFSLYEGVTFTGAMLVRRQALTAARQGRALAAESPFLGLSDFCVASGCRIWPYPEAVVHRAAEVNLRVRNPVPARIGAYDAASAADRFHMLATGYGGLNGEPSLARRREIALALVDRGLAPVVRVASWTLRGGRGIRGRLRRSSSLAWIRRRGSR